MRHVQEIASPLVKLPRRAAYSQLITLQLLTTTQESNGAQIRNGLSDLRFAAFD
jgi:hypothetical protein